MICELSYNLLFHSCLFIQGPNPQAMEFIPGARNTAPPSGIKEFLPHSQSGPPPPGPPPPGVPPPDFLPNNLSADFPPLRPPPSSQPDVSTNSIMPEIPEFVPRSIAAALAGHNPVQHMRNSTSALSLGTLGPGGLHNSGKKSFILIEAV